MDFVRLSHSLADDDCPTDKQLAASTDPRPYLQVKRSHMISLDRQQVHTRALDFIYQWDEKTILEDDDDREEEKDKSPSHSASMSDGLQTFN